MKRVMGLSTRACRGALLLLALCAAAVVASEDDHGDHGDHGDHDDHDHDDHAKVFCTRFLFGRGILCQGTRACREDRARARDRASCPIPSHPILLACGAVD